MDEGSGVMSYISNQKMTLALLGVDPDGSISSGIGGITRLQKYLYLLTIEEKIEPSGKGFEFKAYKAGPYSSKLYDDLEFLENLGLIESEITAVATDEEAIEIGDLSFDDLMGDSAELNEDGKLVDGFGASDAYDERRYILTQEGKEKVQELLDNPEFRPVIDSIRKIKSKFNNYSLSDLLYYVYTRYPEMTVESEIKDKILKHGRRL